MPQGKLGISKVLSLLYPGNQISMSMNRRSGPLDYYVEISTYLGSFNCIGYLSFAWSFFQVILHVRVPVSVETFSITTLRPVLLLFVWCLICRNKGVSVRLLVYVTKDCDIVSSLQQFLIVYIMYLSLRYHFSFLGSSSYTMVHKLLLTCLI